LLKHLLAAAALTTGITVPVAATTAPEVASASVAVCAPPAYATYPTLMGTCMNVVGFEEYVSFIQYVVYNTSSYTENADIAAVDVNKSGSFIPWSETVGVAPHSQVTVYYYPQACFPGASDLYGYVSDTLDPVIIDDPEATIGNGSDGGRC
jgi:hypothetical protein